MDVPAQANPTTRFAITDAPIDVASLRAGLAHPASGALAAFEGWVRDHHGGRPVTHLRYEAHPELAARAGEAVLRRVAARHAVRALACVHRVGDLVPGDVAVWVGATADHRDAAFAAAREAIDAVKADVPIWKDERYADGTRCWVGSP